MNSNFNNHWQQLQFPQFYYTNAYNNCLNGANKAETESGIWYWDGFANQREFNMISTNSYTFDKQKADDISVIFTMVLINWLMHSFY